MANMTGVNLSKLGSLHDGQTEGKPAWRDHGTHPFCVELRCQAQATWDTACIANKTGVKLELVTVHGLGLGASMFTAGGL